MESNGQSGHCAGADHIDRQAKGNLAFSLMPARGPLKTLIDELVVAAAATDKANQVTFADGHLNQIVKRLEFAI